MGYRIDQPQRVSAEVRRIATERLDNALGELRNGVAEDPAAAIHNARKDLKKTRSLLRLVRESLREESYRTENARLRDAAQVLASVRESDAMVVSLSRLIEASVADMSPGCAADAKAWLGHMTSGPAGRSDVTDAAASASLIIEDARDDARLWSLGDGGWEMIEPGLRKAYRRGRDGFSSAMDAHDDEAFHEWRKRVKDLWYHLRLLSQVWPAVVDPMAGEVHRLSENLGDHHDLAELAATAISSDSPLRDEFRAELVDHARARQRDLIAQAKPLADRLYGESPRQFTGRIESYWRAWEG